MMLICLLVLLIFPLLSPFFHFFGMAINKKNRFIYFLFFALILGLIAFLWIPNNQYDLYTWHAQMSRISTYSFHEFIQYAFQEGEILAWTIKYIFSFVNHNFMEMFCITVSYSALFYMLHDYSKENNISNLSLFINIFFIVLSIPFLNFISGIWFVFSTIIFALGVYFDFVKNKKKYAILFYLIALCLHTSMIYPILLRIAFGNKNSANFGLRLFIIAVLSILATNLIPIFLNVFSFPFLSQINVMYQYYFLSTEFNELHSLSYILLRLLQVAPCIYIYLNTEEKTPLERFGFFVFVSFILLIIPARIFARFGLLIQLLFIPTLLKYFQRFNYKTISLIHIYIFLLSCYLIYDQGKAMIGSGIFTALSNNLFQSIFNVIGRILWN